MDYNARNIQKLSQKAFAPFLALSVVGYFIYHSLQGERGILAWVQLQGRLTHAQGLLNEIMRERQELEEKVQALRPESISKDLLDQQVRSQLGYTHPDEIMILRLNSSRQK